MFHRTLLISLCLCVSVASVVNSVRASTPACMAIWDPQHGEAATRFHLDLPAVQRSAGWLQDGGVAVQRLTAAQISNPSVFSAQKFDGIIFIGNAFPRSDLEAMKKFAGDGGVLIDLSTDVPFLICVEPQADGLWALSPAQPPFAWQNYDILKLLGLRDDYQKAALAEQGIAHHSTPLLKHYLPDAPDLRGKFGGRWIVPLSAGKGTPGEIYPLLRSQRGDGADVPPQMYVVQCGAARAIISNNNIYTSDAAPAVWPCGKQTVVALANLARDLHDKTMALTPDMKVEIGDDLKLIAAVPLDRLAIGSIEPDHAEALARWGKFDGSGMEFGPALVAGKSQDLPVNVISQDFPAALEAGASVQLALPELKGDPLYLRVRGAYKATGAALKAALGSQVVLNESFVYIDTSGPSNFNHNLVGVASEFTRIVFIPPASPSPTVLTLSNPGKSAIYFDAVQIERRTQPAPVRWIGLGGGNGNYPAELAKTWSAARMSLRTNLVGPPDDPNRFAQLDELFNKIAAKNERVQPILEGTPAWAAISPERLADAQKAKRERTVPPDPAKYAQIVAQLVQHLGNRVSSYEIWNEADISQFYRGSPEEYAQLFKTVVPIVHQFNPAAIVFTSMSGFRPDYLRKLNDAGVFQMSDLIGFHPYSGKSPGWDTPYGQIEGWLMSQGIDKEVYCNESGFPCANIEWFKAPPQMTTQVQRDLLNVAMARTLACGVPKLNVFNAGGDGSEYGLFDASGHARPAYAVFADYVQLGQPGARRLDISMTTANGEPLQGIYAAASSYEDGSITIVVNPAEAEGMPVQLCIPLDKARVPKATIKTAQGDAPIPVDFVHTPDLDWAKITLFLQQRTVLQLRP